MKKLSSEISNAFLNVQGSSSDELKKALRVGAVRAIWEDLVEDVILQHTNGVYILDEDGKKVMHVYVDEGIYAAELNNRRELIQLLCAQKFGEVVEEFQIHISYGLMKKRYPYGEKRLVKENNKPPVPLNSEEKAAVEQMCSVIGNETVREQFRKAVISDLEWKKGNLQ